ncbi:Rieske 2Fe-2S domain-containing protein [Chitinophaga sp. G-6-1-13]|uniref:Rieske 2Fe-2S domain-containing protein n=1 Tax=Chitinophaga fulva TaxID=2728842 RepID=A0A848GH20_9BACT|nr:Rieske 2Fe-2S domain-containing protein [Chitinophaga fulva]NML36342.1 Rieske 2Fe-2S domain-containing protein [Chitinophaga fulva]
MAKKYTWHKLDEGYLPLADNAIRAQEVNGKMISVALHQGQLYAFAHKCPHAGGIMSDGFIDAAGNVACPIHRYKFSMKNGHNCSGEGYFLKTYPIEQREDGPYVGMEKSGGWLW